LSSFFISPRSPAFAVFLASSSSSFFTATATTEIYTLSLHDALPILALDNVTLVTEALNPAPTPVSEPGTLGLLTLAGFGLWLARSEEHTSELQSRENLVCRLLLEKKKKEIDNQV